MRFFKDLASGFSGFFRAFGFAMGNGMGWMFLVPALLWLLLAFGLYQVVHGYVDQLGAWLGAYLEIPVASDDEGWWSDLKSFMNGAREVLVMLILKLAIGYLLFVANKYIVLILLSPLLAYASERTEEKLTGRAFPFSWGQLMKDALRGAFVAARNGVLEVSITVVIWLATLFVPIIAPLSFIALFVVSAYFYGFSMFDYVFERRRMRIGETVRAVYERLGAVMANGASFSLLMKVPLFGIMLAPVMASIGAVLTMVERERGGVASATGTVPDELQQRPV